MPAVRATSAVIVSIGPHTSTPIVAAATDDPSRISPRTTCSRVTPNRCRNVAPSVWP